MVVAYKGESNSRYFARVEFRDKDTAIRKIWESNSGYSDCYDLHDTDEIRTVFDEAWDSMDGER